MAPAQPPAASPLLSHVLATHGAAHTLHKTGASSSLQLPCDVPWAFLGHTISPLTLQLVNLFLPKIFLVYLYANYVSQ